MHPKPQSSTVESDAEPMARGPNRVGSPQRTRPSHQQASAVTSCGGRQPEDQFDQQQAVTLLIMARRVCFDPTAQPEDFARAAQLTLRAMDMTLGRLWRTKRADPAPSGLEAKVMFTPILLDDPADARAFARCAAELRQPMTANQSVAQGLAASPDGADMAATIETAIETVLPLAAVRSDTCHRQ